MFLICQLKNLLGGSSDSKLRRAKCIIEDHSKLNSGVKGEVFLDERSDGSTRIYGTVVGLKSGKHGFHVHETGDLSKGCNSLLGHYNPFNLYHGGRTVIDSYGRELENCDRHVGDLGNIESINGVAKFDFVDSLIKLRDPYSVLGRSLIVHADPDDLGKGGDAESLKTGNAGKRIGCGIIFFLEYI